jgi:hypothetical protein
MATAVQSLPTRLGDRVHRYELAAAPRRYGLIRLSKPMQQSPQLLLACVLLFHPPAQPSHNRRYARSGSYLGAAEFQRRFHKAPFRSLERARSINRGKPADDFGYPWNRSNRGPEKGFLFNSRCHDSQRAAQYAGVSRPTNSSI